MPWHRIVRADGSLAKGARQRALLEAEGVPFPASGSTCAPRGCPSSAAAACGSSARSGSTRARAASTSSREVVTALPELTQLRVGLLHLHILHTSASLTLNENASPDVRRDFASWFDRAVPEDAPYWTHTLEGPTTCPRT